MRKEKSWDEEWKSVYGNGTLSHYDQFESFLHPLRSKGASSCSLSSFHSSSTLGTRVIEPFFMTSLSSGAKSVYEFIISPHGAALVRRGEREGERVGGMRRQDPSSSIFGLLSSHTRTVLHQSTSLLSLSSFPLLSRPLCHTTEGTL